MTRPSRYAIATMLAMAAAGAPVVTAPASGREHRVPRPAREAVVGRSVSHETAPRTAQPADQGVGVLAPNGYVGPGSATGGPAGGIDTGGP